MARVSNRYQTVVRSALNSQKLGKVSRDAESLFFRVLLAVDYCGRFHSDPFAVGAHVYRGRMKSGEVTMEDIAGWLDELEEVGLIERYVVDGDELLQVVDFYRPTNAKLVPHFAGPDESDPQGGDQGPQEVPQSGDPGKGQEGGPSKVPKSGALGPPEQEQEKEQSSSSSQGAASGSVTFEPPAAVPDDWLARQVQEAEALLSDLPQLGKVSAPVRSRLFKLAAVQLSGEPPGGWGEPPNRQRELELQYRNVAGDISAWVRTLVERKKPGGRWNAYMRAIAEHGPEPDSWLPPGTPEKPERQAREAS